MGRGVKSVSKGDNGEAVERRIVDDDDHEMTTTMIRKALQLYINTYKHTHTYMYIIENPNFYFGFLIIKFLLHNRLYKH
ncbi:hypothetical protein L6452_32330 [Arctium lappa]|uniref:Uncharacterized protein n=1 Tax=Arctium lappa TaxID=4217 RepID=A0ACB8Z4N5_ARCLA|nr:hypothetical protein L6452_32330 [Arctium lappa]